VRCVSVYGVCGVRCAVFVVMVRFVVVCGVLVCEVVMLVVIVVVVVVVVEVVVVVVIVALIVVVVVALIVVVVVVVVVVAVVVVVSPYICIHLIDYSKLIICSSLATGLQALCVEIAKCLSRHCKVVPMQPNLSC
jgi:hypothetical protein